MDVTRNVLKEEYKDLVLNPGWERKEFDTKCLQFLTAYSTTKCFKFLPLNDVFQDFLKIAQMKGVEGEFLTLVKIFELFEKYAAAVAAKPWCKDLHTIKVYTGFFKYNFQQWLSSKTVYKIFSLIGYEIESSDSLLLQTPADQSRSLVIGFELYLAYSQLFYIAHTELISSQYRMDNILEGWLNTSGNVADIRHWMVQNVLKIKEGAEFNRNILSRKEDNSGAKAKSDSLSVRVKCSFDKNGRYISEPIIYPPRSYLNERNESNCDYRSLPSSKATDFQLYGDHGDDDMLAVPGTTRQNEYIDSSRQDTEPVALNEYLNVVARGGNLQRDSSNVETKVTDIASQKEKADRIFNARRNRNLFGSGTQGASKTRAQEINEIGTENQVERETVEGEHSSHQPFSRNTFLDRTSNSEVTDIQRLCIMCSEPATMGCENCKITVCINDKCSKILETIPCNGDGAHRVYYFPSWEDVKSRQHFGCTQYKQSIQGRLYTNTLPNLASGSEPMDWRPSCANCGKPPCYGCHNCDELFCQDCFKYLFEENVCGGKPHEFRQVSNV